MPKCSWKGCEAPLNNSGYCAEHKRQYMDQSGKREKAKEYARNHYRQNKAYHLAKRNKRRAAELQRTPGWADAVAIDFVYHCAKTLEAHFDNKWHVDHIHPLQGTHVSGLHVAENLQLLRPSDNLRKSNASVK